MKVLDSLGDDVDGAAGHSPEALSAFTDFCQAEYQSLLRAATILVGDRWLGEDIAQEALARAWTRWARVSTLEQPALWTRRVALNIGQSALRRSRIANLTRPLVNRHPSNNPTSELDSALADALSALTPRQRAAVAWRYLADLPVGDVARIMGCKEGTVKALASQGVARLRSVLVTRSEDNL